MGLLLGVEKQHRVEEKDCFYRQAAQQFRPQLYSQAVEWPWASYLISVYPSLHVEHEDGTVDLERLERKCSFLCVNLEQCLTDRKGHSKVTCHRSWKV